MKRFKFCLIALLIIFIIIIFIPRNQSSKITIEEMYEIIDDGIIIDVRTSSEYESYNLSDSINIPLDDIYSVEDIIIDKDTQIFVYCATGNRSSQAYNILINLEYTNVYDIGGIYN
ncbi:MAG: rhodanese-like domain-containing protein [Mycoplasmatota bacterium]